MPRVNSEPCIVEPEQADLHLWISNQSFLDDPVVLTVEVDGVELTSRPLVMRNQHRLLLPLQVPSGSHSISVVSDTGAQLRQEFTLSWWRGRRFAVIDYWNSADGDGRRITWRLYSRQVRFM